jgi:hypothetical protein
MFKCTPRSPSLLSSWTLCTYELAETIRRLNSPYGYFVTMFEPQWLASNKMTRWYKFTRSSNQPVNRLEFLQRTSLECNLYTKLLGRISVKEETRLNWTFEGCVNTDRTMISGPYVLFQIFVSMHTDKREIKKKSCSHSDADTTWQAE